MNMENNCCSSSKCESNPSTSKKPDSTSTKEQKSNQQLDDLDDQQLNEALESYAQTYNLTAQKVKNIIHHVVKNPQTFATLIRRYPDMIGLRITRLRLRQLERIVKHKIPTVELKPINIPKTCLDINFDDDGDEQDAEDADYNPYEESESDGENMEENGVDKISQTPTACLNRATEKSETQMAMATNAELTNHTVAVTNCDELSSCSLLVPSNQLRISEKELRTLKVQFEKHVQLLCQCIIGTSQCLDMIDLRDRAVAMVRELDEESQRQENNPNSLFHITNLEATIYSAHDIQACQEVDLPLKNQNENQPSNEMMWVLARSQACHYPELFPAFRFCLYPQPHTYFLQSEQLLLALALFELKHVPHTQRSRDVFAAFRKGRYKLISEYFLPNKTVAQIRNHMKNARSCPSPTVMHNMILQAERGIFDVKYQPEPDQGTSAQLEIPLNWPEHLQPFWLKGMAELFRESNVEIKTIGVDESTTTTLLDRSKLITANKESDQFETIERQHNEKNKFSKSPKRTASIEFVDDEELSIIKKRTMANQEHENDHTKDLKKTSVDHVPACNLSSQDEFDFDVGLSLTINKNKNVDMNIKETDSNNVETNKLATIMEEQCPTLQKKSLRRQRVERGLLVLCNQETCEKTMSALVYAIYTDFKQRMFMHQEKFRAVQSILIRSDHSIAERFLLLWEQLGYTHPQLFFLFAAIAPEHELPISLRVHPDRLTSKKVLRMIHTIQTYMSGSRSAMHMKNTLKFLKNLRYVFRNEDNLFETLQKHIGVRDEPLWLLLRREWMSANFVENVNNWEFECIDLDKLGASSNAFKGIYLYENINMPYRCGPAERNRLHYRNGHLKIELNGRLRNVTIDYEKSTDERQEQVSHDNITILDEKETEMRTTNVSHQQTLMGNSSSANSSLKQQQNTGWTREMDALLLMIYNRAECNRQKCITTFLATPFGSSVNQTDVDRRLKSLINVAKQLQIGVKPSKNFSFSNK